MGNFNKISNVLITCIIVSSVLIVFVPVILTQFTDLSGSGLILGSLFGVVLPLIFGVSAFIFLKNVATG